MNNKKYICTKCGKEFDSIIAKCSECGSSVTLKNIVNPLSNMTINEVLNKRIESELLKNNFSSNYSIPEVEKRKQNLSMIFSIMLFIYVCLIYFHISIALNIFGFIVLLILYIYMSKYNVKSFISKQIIARPDDKISDIVSSFSTTKVEKKTKARIIIIFVALLLPEILFYKPLVIYENTDEGYYLRFYTLGLTDNTIVTIPEKYKGVNVVGIRGNVFRNMYFLKEVNLPETITTIRGQAFKNDINLEKINIPKNVSYLGGEAFKNCFSLKSIDIPLKITEIKGNTFENCTSLKSVIIPEGVTRIAAHAFCDCSSLSNVVFPKTVVEIGSSAFRRCYNLRSVALPVSTIINEKAFKESPTTINYLHSTIEEIPIEEETPKELQIESVVNYESDYIEFNKSSDDNVIKIKNLEIQYYSSINTRNSKVGISGVVTNAKNYIGNINIKVVYYDSNHNEVVSNIDKIELLGPDYPGTAYYSGVVTKSIEEIKYFKIFISSIVTNK